MGILAYRKNSEICLSEIAIMQRLTFHIRQSVKMKIASIQCLILVLNQLQNINAMILFLHYMIKNHTRLKMKMDLFRRKIQKWKKTFLHFFGIVLRFYIFDSFIV